LSSFCKIFRLDVRKHAGIVAFVSYPTEEPPEPKQKRKMNSRGRASVREHGETMPKINEHNDKQLLSAMALEKTAQSIVSETKRAIQVLDRLHRIGHTGKARIGEAFVRSVARETKSSRSTVYTDLRRARTLGFEVLKTVQGTSLDHGRELDALALLSLPQRQRLIGRAAAGEIVSAIKALKGRVLR